MFSANEPAVIVKDVVLTLKDIFQDLTSDATRLPDDESIAQTDITLFVQRKHIFLGQGPGQACSVQFRGRCRSLPYTSIYTLAFRRPREDDESAQQVLRQVT